MTDKKKPDFEVKEVSEDDLNDVAGGLASEVDGCEGCDGCGTCMN